MWVKRLSVTLNQNSYNGNALDFDFEHSPVLITSGKNSFGKTTLIRFILFSMGFSVASTHGIQMKKCTVSLSFRQENNDYTAVRKADMVVLSDSQNVIIGKYDLKKAVDVYGYQRFVFGAKNNALLDNILAAFFIDQEYGWKCAAGGKPSGGVKTFSCTNLLAGVFEKGGLDEVENDISRLKNEINKYTALNKVVSIDDRAAKVGIITATNDPNQSQEIKTALKSQLLNRKYVLEQNRNRLSSTLNENETLQNFVERLNIPIRLPESGEIVFLTKEMIADFCINNDMLRVELMGIESELEEINKQLRNFNNEDKQLTFLEVKTISDNAYTSLKNSGIKSEQLSALTSDTKLLLKRKKDERLEIIRSNQLDYSRLQKEIIKELSRFTDASTFSNVDVLKMRAGAKFSGIELHDICYSYTIGLYNFLTLDKGYEMPLIIDSPGSAERKINDLAQLIDHTLEVIGNRQLIIASAAEIDETKFESVIDAYGRIFEGKYVQRKPA